MPGLLLVVSHAFSWCNALGVIVTWILCAVACELGLSTVDLRVFVGPALGTSLETTVWIIPGTITWTVAGTIDWTVAGTVAGTLHASPKLVTQGPSQICVPGLKVCPLLGHQSLLCEAMECGQVTRLGIGLESYFSQLDRCQLFV